VTIVTSALTTEVHGDGVKVNGLSYKDRTTDALHRVELEGIFVQIGLVPNTEWLKDSVALSPRGEIEVDPRGATSIPGVFAAGDATTTPFKQIVIAMGEGSKAALSAFDYLIRQPVAETAQHIQVAGQHRRLRRGLVVERQGRARAAGLAVGVEGDAQHRARDRHPDPPAPGRHGRLVLALDPDAAGGCGRGRDTVARLAHAPSGDDEELAAADRLLEGLHLLEVADLRRLLRRREPLLGGAGDGGGGVRDRAADGAEVAE
jgi:hypothetical protein